MKNILITGCSGLLGAYLIRDLVAQGDCRIFGLTEVSDFVSNDAHIFHCDIRDRDAVFKAVEEAKPDVTFHLAAIANVGFSWKHQKLTYEVNFIGSSNLIEAVSLYVPNSRILLMSSAELYGGAKTNLLNEDVAIAAKNPYALSKVAMELLGRLYQESKNLDVITLRSFNFTGPGQDRKFVASDFSHQIALIEHGKQEPVIRVGNLSAIRDISDVRDISRYMTVVAKKGQKGGLYNLCCGCHYSIQDILDILLSLSSKKIEVVVDKNKFRPIDVPKLTGSSQRLKDEFNLSPNYPLRQTLLDLLDEWRGKVLI